MAFVLLSFLSPLANAQTGTPRILASDLTSGPATGGPNGGGAFVTIYGEGFGTSRATSRVTIGGVAATTYPLWTDTKISFQLPATAKTGNIVATVNGVASNGVRFTVRAGRIYFVSPQGADSAAGSVDQPWRTLESAVSTMAPGDIVYVRDGYVDTSADVNASALSITRAGTSAMPFAVVAYPGARATIGSTSSTAWGIRGMKYAHHWVFAGLQVRGLTAAFDLARNDNWRLAGNDLSCPNGSNKGGCLWAYASNSLKVLANTIHDTGSTSASSLLDYQSVWIESSNNLEFSWNTVRNTRGCNAIFLDGNGWNYGITLDGNRISDARCDGVKITGYDTTRAATRLQNNILIRVGTGPAPAGGEGTYACFNVAGTGSTAVSILHNTLYDCGRRADSKSGALKTSRLVRFDNNIVALASGESYVASSSTSGTISGNRNLFWGAGAPPQALTGSLNADPRFASASTDDLRLSQSSPAIDAASAVAVAWDALRMSRPFGAAPDLGAFEYTGTTDPAATRVLAQQPTSLNFGSVATYSTTTKQVTLSNTGTEAVSVTSVTSTNSSFQISSSAPLTLQPGQSTTYSVTFAPTSAASYSGTISVYGDADNSPLILAVAGTAATQGTATLSANPAALAFGEVATGTTLAKTVTISNMGNLAASISDVNVTGSGFSGSSSTLPITLAAGASTTVTVRFSPTSTSAYGNLEVVSNATNSPLNIQLTGTLATGSTGGRTFYVDSRLTTASCATYSASARSCGAGTALAYRDLNSASGAALPGDTVLVRGGSFSTQFTPQQSGTQSAPITFKAYPNETVTITGVSAPALYILNKSHIVIDGFTISNVTAWGRIETSNNITIKNSRLTVATSSGTTGSIKFVSSHYNRLLNNWIENGNDNVYLQDSNYNLVQGNTIRTGRHTLLNISCGNYNVVRGNTFHNASQKAGEVYDCEGMVTNQPVKLNATKRNVWENNRFTYTRTSTSPNDYNGIQFAGQDGIVRRNVFYDNQGGGLRVAHYSDEALYVYGNRIYNNTFYGNHCYGLSTDGDSDSARYYNNDLRNNLHYRNTDCSGGPTQMANSNATANASTKNILFTSSPGFVNETERDFRLAAGSAAIDAGAFLTTTAAAGSGTSLRVADARYFFDGFGIAGEVGDTIQLQGSGARARVVRIDYATNTLTLNASLTWSSGQGVALAFGGNAPDVGAQEADGTTAQPDAAPAGSVTANPTAVAFGSVLLNSSSSKALILTNGGGSSVTVSQLSVSNGAYSITGATLPLTIPAGGSAAVTVNFRPTAVGTYTGTLTAVNNGSPSTVSIPLSGSGFEATAGRLTPGASSINFGTINTGTGASSTLRLTNTGGSNLSISQLAFSSTAFSASGVSLPVTLAPSQSINVTVTFRPPSAATYQATLTIYNTGSPSAVAVGLSGTAAAAEAVTPPPAPTGWQAPIGIPNPGWGITDASPNPATKCANWPSAASPGCFYVNPQAAGATDSSNPNGYPGKPRLTIPVSSLGCGSYVEIHGTLSQSVANSGRVDL
ncbi:MAG TPA: choice-of-anchor D domain-containing protein, partial [Clostridia bacterium]|nr:choice-of-anchor D domain-containing protein [Clostridia bacterium]